MKKNLFHSRVLCPLTKQRLLLMFNWIFFFVFILCMKVSANGFSQDTRVSIDIKKMEFKKVLSLLERKGNFHFLYSNELLPNKEITLAAKDEFVLSILQKLLDNTGLKYKAINNELVVIAPLGEEIKDGKIKGKITDENGKPLVGVSILVEGTRSGTSTNDIGEFDIAVPEKATLIISYVGYISQTVQTDGKTRIDLTLKINPVVSNLEDIVVVGYGTQKRKDVTGSVSSVPKARLTELPVTNVLQAIEGSVAGFTITNTS